MTERVPSIEELIAQYEGEIARCLNDFDGLQVEPCESCDKCRTTVAVLRSVRQLLEDYRTLCAFDDERIALLDALLANPAPGEPGNRSET